MKKAMVYGLGTSGRAAVELLKSNSYEVIEVDDRKELNSKEALKYIHNIEFFVKSPGIPYNFLTDKVNELGIELIDEIELAYRLDKTGAKIIAITGTNGKTTTCTKIAELLKLAGYRVKAGGNIGKAYSEIILSNEKLDYLVLELSSYQLENIKTFKGDISIIINLSEDHLDRYSNVEEYYKTKLNILKNQGNKDYFILNLDSQELQEFSLEYRQKVMKITCNLIEGADLYIEDKFVKGFGKSTLEIDKFSLKGRHNLENIMFILAVGKILQIEFKLLRNFLYSTQALEHRMEIALEKKGVFFINDSKGTNIDSTIKAIEAYSQRLILICGGKDKGLDFSPLINTIILKVKKVYLIGETADKLEILLKKNLYEEVYNFGVLEEVINNLEVQRGDVVLFSPAHSSFDQFNNYIERGNKFKELVKKRFD